VEEINENNLDRCRYLVYTYVKGGDFLITTIQRWGNSQAVRLPKVILETLFLKENDPVEILANDDSIIIKKATPKRRAKKGIDERLEEFYKKPIADILADDTLYATKEYDWGKPMGREVW